MFYYLLHNVVWLANMGAIYRHLIENTLGWRDIKDAFSLLSNVTESARTTIRVIQIRRKIEETEKKLEKATQAEVPALAAKWISQRSKHRLCWLSVVSAVLRII